MTQRLWYMIGFLALAVIAGATMLVRSGTPEIVFQSARVERGALVTSITASGTVALKNSVDVVTPHAGRVVSTHVNFNETVEAGQVLARIDETDLQAKVAVMRANLEIAEGARQIAADEAHSADLQVESARAQLESSRSAVEQARLAVADAERELQLAQKLSKSGDAPRVEAERLRSRHAMAISAVQLEKSRETAAGIALEAATVKANVARAQLANAGATIASRQAELREAMSRVDGASLRAPIAGVVVDRRAGPLDTVAAGTRLFTIAASLKDIEIRARVDEADIGRVAVGQAVRLTFDAYPGEPFSGQVTEMRSLPEDVAGVVTYATVISVANDDLRLRPGMTAEATIIVATREDTVKIPRAALRFNPAAVGIEALPAGPAVVDSNGARVWLLGPKGELQARTIRTGISDFVSIEVIDGSLTPGQEVIVGASRAKKRGGIGSLNL